MIDWKALAAPFPPTDIEWRLAQVYEKNGEIKAKCLAYITNRAIQDRLDEVVGPMNWKNEYEPWEIGTPGVLCGISIRTVAMVREDGDHTILESEWITKWDGAEQTDIEHVKGGLSNAMKRAAVQWGIGRYLYDLTAGWAKINPNGQFYGKTKEGTSFHWDAPDLPKWALPDAGSAQMDQSGDSEQAGGSAVKASTQQPPEQTYYGKDEQWQARKAVATSPPASTPLVRPGPYAPTEKQVNFFTKLMGSNVFTEEERKRGMEWLAKSGTRETIKSQIDWAKAQVAQRENKQREPGED